MGSRNDQTLTRKSSTRFGIILIEQFPLSSLAAVIEPLRAANRLSGREVYRWVLATENGGDVPSSCGIQVRTVSFPDAFREVDVVLVCAGLRVKPDNESRHIVELRKLGRRGVLLGAVSAGTWLLARSGLLDGYRCTAHWENRAALVEEFPTLDCSDRIYEIDRGRLTCSGGTGAMDLMLSLIRDELGSELAQRVANQFHHERIRSSEDEQRGGGVQQVAALPPKLRAIFSRMQVTVENPIPIPELAREAGITVRQLERLCLRYFGSGPTKLYLKIRVERGRELLTFSRLSVLEISAATGFASSSHFSDWFRRLQGVKPSEYRARALGLRENRTGGHEM